MKAKRERITIGTYDAFGAVELKLGPFYQSAEPATGNFGSGIMRKAAEQRLV
jgi:hypothetical protein